MPTDGDDDDDAQSTKVKTASEVAADVVGSNTEAVDDAPVTETTTTAPSVRPRVQGVALARDRFNYIHPSAQSCLAIYRSNLPPFRHEDAPKLSNPPQLRRERQQRTQPQTQTWSSHRTKHQRPAAVVNKCHQNAEPRAGQNVPSVCDVVLGNFRVFIDGYVIHYQC